jgi:hypothetical protein
MKMMMMKNNKKLTKKKKRKKKNVSQNAMNLNVHLAHVNMVHC